MEKRKNFIVKIVLSYIVLASLAILAGWFFYLELENILPKTQKINPKEERLLKISTLTNDIYTAESLSKLALQRNTKKDFAAYAVKVDSILFLIDTLKISSESNKHISLLDSLAILLQQKVANNDQLRRLATKNYAEKSLDSLILKIKTLEATVGTITPRALVPNFDQLPEATQKSVIAYAELLNENAKREEGAENERKMVDSILIATQDLLLDTRKKHLRQNQQIANKEYQILRTDIEISQKLRDLVSTLEQEVLAITANANLEQSIALKKSTKNIKWLGILAFIIILLSIYFITRDFRRVQRLSTQLEAANTYTKELLQSREQLIKTVSHDMRSPLGVIKGYADLLPTANRKEDTEKYISNIQVAANHVNKLANDLLDFSKLEAGKLLIEPTNFIPAQLIEEIATSLKPANTAVALQLDIAATLQQTFKTDPFRLRQILTNLISNAFKFTQNGYVKINADLQKDAQLKITIADTGSGIPKSIQQTIFNEFTQAETNVKKEGYGLGLTIAQKLTHLLGGKISFTSEENKGTTFYVEVPVEHIETNSRSKSTDYSSKKVVLIDDDTSLLALLSTFLEQLNIPHKTFTKLSDVPKTIGFEYDIVFTDMQMPTNTGFEVLHAFKQQMPHYKGQPIIAMTGNRTLNAHRCIKAGFAQLLYKPFSKGELQSALMNHLKIASTVDTVKNTTKQTFYYLNTEPLTGFLDPAQLDEKLRENLRIFYQETLKNYSLIEHALASKNQVVIKEIAHKMLPMFRLLQISEVIPHLEQLEAEAKTRSKEHFTKALENVLNELKAYLNF
ncbi:hybrid sensor histidine kinase/response regulator [Croceivirga sp. JEA036]|uniref:ATP-binding response regulator n=1 Tax=Croceivirga sp. JEA036 TaxID=2721162 RepID=UPI00143A1F2F|nr:hybrid sensor histidine kinase/response regulator [Croceivirga sp. JEA036]NJB36815.1 response regulator [Croceivirga sp. JEA036]